MPLSASRGTTTLFAALDTANGKVLRMLTAPPASEYLSFLREIEKSVPKNLAVHIIVDNYATHKHLRVRRWFATRPRFHVHFTPTYDLVNQVKSLQPHHATSSSSGNV